MWINITEEQFLSLRKDLGEEFKTAFFQEGKYVSGTTYSVCGNDMLQYTKNTHTKQKRYYKNNEFVIE
ncbi:hypothetical protein VP277E431_P0176 [Vibrio phage 277E43-1]|nr:hypothetical protein VP277E431_P0176 [Vibrio phage 277E43-1]